ncbi:pirin family protein [Aeromonas veronii]|uniref:pirin family protein n=1 Tax=Aeromonas veronii TaxID=654 RepID=UPI0032EB58EB
MKSVIGIYSAPRPHWVGDGFPVRSLFSYQSHGKAMSPFLLLDRAGPMEFAPSPSPRGVGEHPHRGFETVTIVYKGEVAHRDSTGQGGIIGPGDVQWMTAASGIMHDEFHAEGFSQQGGTLDMVQLWVNLPAREKMSSPGYQAIGSDSIPVHSLADGTGVVRIIAGELAGQTGPARTFTPMNVWDLRLNGGASTLLPLVDGWNSALVVLKGRVRFNGLEEAGEAQLVLLEPSGNQVQIEASEDAVLLLLSGEPIDEPIVGYGPFVMNTEAEIVQAIDDFNSGRFAQIPQ